MENESISKENMAGRKLAATGFLGIILIIFSSLHAFVFANNIYHLIPSYVGGGKSVPVEVYVDEKSAANDSFKSCWLTKDKSGPWMAQLMLATDKAYVFSVGDYEQILWIKKDEVKAVSFDIDKNKKKKEDAKQPKPSENLKDKKNENHPQIQTERNIGIFITVNK
jgi:hypothetical protein